MPDAHTLRRRNATVKTMIALINSRNSNVLPATNFRRLTASNFRRNTFSTSKGAKCSRASSNSRHKSRSLTLKATPLFPEDRLTHVYSRYDNLPTLSRANGLPTRTNGVPVGGQKDVVSCEENDVNRNANFYR